MRYIDFLHREHLKEYKIRRLRRRPPERLDELVRKFYEEVRLGMPILVEGKNDVKALESCFGFGNYITIYRKRTPLRAVVQESIELFGRRQIILTDLDKKGNKLAEKIRGIVNEMGGVPILKYRNMLRLFDVQFVESLASRAEEIKLMLGLIKLGDLHDEFNKTF
jgi:5S rRNA maturation endonuclease (ribonuclease M5)